MIADFEQTVCGPNVLKSSVSNTVADMQKLVLEKKIETISLDGETFGRLSALILLPEARANCIARMVMRPLISFRACFCYIPIRPQYT